ncbi:MAG: LysR family transcriptional regulator, partial [Myxococcota bacterium]
MHLSAVDLNLLVVLDALLDTQSIKEASQRLALSPSATSHALARLRGQFEDELLTRAGKRMVPTARALRLREPLRDLLEGVEVLLRPEEAVRDPRQVKRTFVIGANDFFELVVLPALLECVEREAPGVELHVRSMVDDGVSAL